MNAKHDLYVIISFDMESDIGSWTDRHTGVAQGTPLILDVLAHHGVTSTFLFTGDAALACPEALARIKAAGHEIGCHTLHHESVGPPIVDVPDVRAVLPEEVPNRLEKATRLIEELAGVRPVSFRAPRGWASSEMLVTLDRLGYVVDSSYMAYFLGEHLLPYHPSDRDWKKRGHLSILEVPLFGDLTIEGGDRYKRDRDQWPALRTRDADWLADAVLRNGERLWSQGKPMLACLYLHPWEFVEMPRAVDTAEAHIEFQDYLWVNTGPVALAQLRRFVERMRRAGAEFHTLRSFYDLWRSRHDSLNQSPH